MVFLAAALAVVVTGCQKKTQSVQQPASADGQLRPYTGTMAPDDDACRLV
jgi:hypothetical protein